MFCTNCGNEIKNNSKFCNKCGTVQHREDVSQIGAKSSRGLFVGRIGRMRFFLGNVFALSFIFIFVALWGFVNILVASTVSTDSILNVIGRLMPILILISFIPTIFLSIALSIRRLHDFGHSGLWVLTCYIPYIGIITGLFLLFRKGDIDNNKFGYPPSKNKKFIEDIFNR